MKFFIDTETTGLPNFRIPTSDATQPNVVEIGIILYDEVEKHINAQFGAIIQPSSWYIDNASKAVETHGITHEKAISFGLPEKSVAHIANQMLKKADTFIAYNESFDFFLLQRLFINAGLDTGYLLSIPRECVMKKCTPICKISLTEKQVLAGFSGYKNPKLSEAYKHFFNEELEMAHSAFADVTATLSIYNEILMTEVENEKH
jgi:DNA polymerase III subunit epsilon